MSPKMRPDLARYAHVWVTTEKDAVKILPGWVGSADLRVLTLELEFDEPELLLDFVEPRIR